MFQNCNIYLIIFDIFNKYYNQIYGDLYNKYIYDRIQEYKEKEK